MSVKSILSSSVCRDDRYIEDYVKLNETLETLRRGGHSISMTQGVYDFIHPGHTRYLEAAKSKGDILVVAVDSDEYTRRRKQTANERRPIVPFEERLEILANLRTVDILTIRDVDYHVDDPDYVIKVVKPNVLVMSQSTKDIDLAKHAELRDMCGSWGGTMALLEPQSAVSTTARLRDLLMDGAGGMVDEIVTTIEAYFQRSGRELNWKGRPTE